MRRMNLCWLILFLLPMTVFAQDDSAPYLYYFSNDINAFVIERADGSDSRIFAADIMPSNTIAVSGAGWSPSGNWFAWTAVHDLSEDLLQTGYVISSDESILFELSKLEQPHISHMVWSPSQDYLLVVYSDEPGCCEVNPTAELIDVAQDAALISFNLAPHTSIREVAWFGNGAGFVIEYEQYNNNLSYTGRYLRRVTLQGEMEDIEIGYTYGGVTYTNWIAYSNPERTLLTLHNLIDNSQRIYDLPEERYHRGQWDYLGEYYAYQTEQDCGNPLACMSHLWVVSPTSHEPTLIANDVYYHTWHRVSAWSPDIQAIIYPTTGGFGYYRADMDVSEFIPISKWPDNGIPNISWLQNGIVYIWLSSATEVYRYSVFRDDLSELPLGFELYIWVHILRDRIVLYRGSDDYEIKQLVDNSVNTIAHHSEAMWANYLDVQIHKSGDWFITIENVPSDFLYKAYGVASIDGNVRREFGTCEHRTSSICADWLPLQVDL